jgi:Ca2+-binding EF-hand superfamily protein
MADRDLNEDEIADLKEAFAMFDINGDGAYIVLLLRGGCAG